jgi:hypothetical protein
MVYARSESHFCTREPLPGPEHARNEDLLLKNNLAEFTSRNGQNSSPSLLILFIIMLGIMIGQVSTNFLYMLASWPDPRMRSGEQ